MNGIDQKLEAARQELLDLGLRNKLINYQLLKTRGVEVVDELPKQVYKVLVESERQMSFLPAPDPEEEGEENEEQDLLFEQPEEEQTGSVALKHKDNKLQTAHISAQLQRRLLNTYYTARTHIEEQGVNVLFLALGLVEWYESDNSELKRRAPLILIPVSLERPSVKSRFYLKYTGDDVGGNLSLQAKFASDEVGIDLPLPGDQDIDVQAYFSKVAVAIEDKPRWSVDTSAIVLGFFSFAKFLMYNDLDSGTWPSDSPPSQHRILEALMESGFGSAESAIGDDEHIDQYVDLEKVHQVVDADSSQTLAILDVNNGKNLVIQGPPGTGKSQTITNLIAEAIGNGKKILFVAEKMAALEVVKRNLDKIGLGDACLELHSHKSNKKAVLDELRRITQLGKPHLLHNGQNLEVLKKNRDRLNRYCEAVNTPIGESQVTPYYAFGRLLNLKRRFQDIRLPDYDDSRLSQFSGVQFQQNLAYIEELQALLSRIGIPLEHLFWGCKCKVFLPNDQSQFKNACQKSLDLVNDLIASIHSLSNELAIAIPANKTELGIVLTEAHRVDSAPDLTGVTIKDSDWLSQRDELLKGLKAGERIQTLHTDFDSRLTPEAWERDVVEIRLSLSTYVEELKVILSRAGIPEDIIQRTQDLINDIIESAQSVSDELAIPIPTNQKELEMLLAVANKANKAPDLSEVTIKDSDWLSQRETLQKGLKAGERIQSLHVEFDSRLTPEAWDQSVVEIRITLLAYVKELKALLSHTGMPEDTIQRTQDLISDITESAKSISDELAMSFPANRNELGMLLAVANKANQAPDLSGISIKDSDWLSQREKLLKGLKAGERIQSLHIEFDSKLTPEAWGQDMISMRKTLAAYGPKWWRFLSGEFRSAKNELAGFCKRGLPNQLNGQLELIDAVLEAKRLESDVLTIKDIASRLFGGLWKAENSDWNRLQEIAHYLGGVYSDVEGNRLLPEIIDYLVLNKDSESLKEKVNRTESLIKGYEAEYGSRWWEFLSEKIRRNNTELAGLCKQGLPKTLGEQIEIVDAIWEINQLKSVVMEVDGLFNRLFGDHWKTENPDWSRLRVISHYLSELHRDVGGNDLVENILDFLVGKNNYETLTQEVIRAESLVQDYEIAANRAIEIIQIDKTERFGNDEIYITQSYESQRQMCQSWISNIESIQDMVSYNHHRENLKNNGLNGIIEISNGWSEAGMHLTDFFKYNWYNSLITRAINERTDLARFDCATHQTVIDKFRELDEVTLRHNRGQLASKHWEYIPMQNSGSGQLGILQHEFEKKRRHLPIRQLINHTGNVIQAIKPVFMMSPLSIATFLPPESANFDIVVFDEASQVKPVDAFGAILRASQAVVVGDSKQLPPTNFFNVIAEADGEDDEDLGINTADMESILGLFCAQDAPQRMLRWHYRSRHESLIAVSNYEFYDNKLQLFPSPDAAKVEVGLIYHLLSDSAYEPGKNARNPKEALAVAKAVMKHARENPERTLGVVTFSMSQMQEVQDQLEILRRQNPDCEVYFSKHPDEPFFVKNLENVQGDERDVIFISVGYGRTADGRLSMNFGPLNQEGGERRLNVLITRAKRRCEVFTNLTGDDIDLGKTKARGVRALKRYLSFAQTGELDIAVPTGRAADSPFEEAVADALRDAGYRIEHQVGVGGFFIDLAVIDEQRPGRYMLGIECDGASYHSARSARDRDRLRQQVLEGMGWQIHRIWSTDWFKRPESELRRAVEAIEKAKVQVATVPPINHDIGGFTIERSDHIPLSEEVVTEKYQMFDMEFDLGDYELHEVPRTTLAVWVEEVVQVEWPIHFEDLEKRIREASGLGRTGPRIRSAIEAAITSATRSKNVQKKRQFLWVKNQEEPTVRDRSGLPTFSRKLEFVAPEEIEAAIKKVVEHAMGMSASDIPQASCKLFGFKAVSEEMRQVISRIVNSMVRKGKLVQQGDFLIVSA